LHVQYRLKKINRLILIDEFRKCDRINESRKTN